MPRNPDPAQPVANMLQSVDELGENTGRLFGRLYGGLRRKQRDREATQPRTQLQIEQLTQLTTTQATDIARLTGVLAVISEGVIMQDNDGRIVLMNQSARDLLGSVRMFWHSELGRMFAEARQRTALDGEITLGEAQRVEVNDRVIGAQLAIVADEQSNRLGTVLMLRDVTHDALSDRLKDQFVTQMSHELRTPLTVIKGMSEILMSLPEGRPPDRKFLEAISRNAATLDRMIVELLDISEISAGSFAVRQRDVYLPELIFTVIQGLRPRIEGARLDLGVMVTNRHRLTILGDDRRLQWAIGHLLDNSVKYTEPGGEIVLRLGRIRDRYMLIEVNDTGVGIHPDDLPRVFERFFRGTAHDSTGRLIDPRGLGQGLFVARAVAEAHGGYLSAASAVNEGSTFTLALPLEGKNHTGVPLREMPAAPPDEPPLSPDTVEPPSQPGRSRV
jgi:two-component system phosphate regulon sensor histidine kinase PhoR